MEIKNSFDYKQLFNDKEKLKKSDEMTLGYLKFCKKVI
jgi:hypothetical protein